MKKILVLLACVLLFATLFAGCDALNDDNQQGLDFYLLPDGTYGVAVGNALYSESIVIPETYKGKPVTSIGNRAFQYCSSLTSVTIPDSVTSIGGSAFQHCSALKSVTIPDSVTSIGNNAFCNTGYYNNDANWENGVLYIGKYLIEAKTTLSGSYTIKDGTTCIADYAFYVCSKLTSVTIPNSVTSIGEHAFSRCDSLTSIKYRGTEQQWENISKDNIGYNGTVTYNYTGQ